MTVQDIASWLAAQSAQALAEFEEGIEHYRWGEDIPSAGQFSTAFELGWKFARLQHSN
jgi:hypothetical protein